MRTSALNPRQWTQVPTHRLQLHSLGEKIVGIPNVFDDSEDRLYRDLAFSIKLSPIRRFQMMFHFLDRIGIVR